MIANQVTRLVQSRATNNPKTPLGFYAAVIIALLTGTTGVSIALATANVETQLIPYVLGIGAGLAALVALGVFVINFQRPQNLLLGQITGREFAAIEKVTLGDSRRGERVVEVGDMAAGGSDPVIVDAAPERPQVAGRHQQAPPIIKGKEIE